MKVLEIMGSLHRGGAETMIMNYYRAFDKKMCQMDFVIHGRFENDYYDEAVNLGANVIETDTPGKVGIFKYILNLTHIIKDYGPYDAIHIHTDYQAFLSVIAGRSMRVKNIIVHSHNTCFTPKMKLVNRSVFNILNVQRMACGKAAGEDFFGKRKFIILHNAIDMKKFQKVNEKMCNENKKKLFGDAYVIGHLGRFNKQKNHEFIIELAKSFLMSDKKVVFACYGEGEEEERIKRIVKEENISNIYFMGVTEDVVSAYHMFDIFILPSTKEGFPVTLIESQLAGIYSLTSDRVSGECDLGINMLQFLPLEVSIWKDEIVHCIEKGTNKIECKDEVVNEFDVNVQWKQLYRIYKGEHL